MDSPVSWILGAGVRVVQEQEGGEGSRSTLGAEGCETKQTLAVIQHDLNLYGANQSLI